MPNKLKGLQANVNPKHFVKEKRGVHKIMRSIIKSNNIPIYAKDDITSLSLNPNSAKQALLESERFVENLDKDPETLEVPEEDREVISEA